MLWWLPARGHHHHHHLHQVCLHHHRQRLNGGHILETFSSCINGHRLTNRLFASGCPLKKSTSLWLGGNGEWRYLHQMFQLPWLEDAKEEVDHRHLYQFRYTFIWNRSINSDTPLSETEACQRVEALDVAALLLNSTIVLTNICWHHHQHSAFSQSIKKMESSLSSEESHKSSLDEGWIEFPGYGLMSGTWVLTTTPPSEHTWLGILAMVQSTGRLKLAHWVDILPIMKTCIKSTPFGILQLSFLSVPKMVHKPFARMMTEESDKSHDKKYELCLSTFCYFMPPMHADYWLCIDIVSHAVLQMIFVLIIG